MRKGRLLCVMHICAITSLFLFLLNPLAQGNELRKLALDDASFLGTIVLSDPRVKQEGNGSIKISTLWPTTICLAQVQELNVENARLIYRAKVKSEELEGTAFLEMWCNVGDLGRIIIKKIMRQVSLQIILSAGNMQRISSQKI